MANVQFSVKSSLKKIVSELMAVRAVAQETEKAVRNAGKAMGDQQEKAAAGAAEASGVFKLGADGVTSGIKKNTKATEQMFAAVRNMGRRLADQLRGDFKSLFSVGALGGALKISDQFRSSITETVQLSDAIRRLGSVFGIAQTRFSGFQESLTKGMGEIGLSSDVAARTLEGLSKTPVRGEGNLIGYSRTSGQLATVGGEKGLEGQIAAGIAQVIQARGGNVNDMGQVKEIAEALRRVFNQTGATPTQSLETMKQLFAQMPKDLRAAISTKGVTNLAAASAVGGPNATKFLEEYLSQSPIQRMAFNAQGGAGIFGDNGLDIEKFRKFSSSIMGRVGGDPRLAAKTLGLSDEAAEGFVRLSENLSKVSEAQDRIARSTGDLSTQYQQAMGLGDAFRASINRVKASLAGPLSAASQGGTSWLANASQSKEGAAAVTSGAGLLALLLGGGGLRGIGSLLGTVAKKEGAEGALGANTIPVYVVNASEIGAGVGSGLGLPPIGGGIPGGNAPGGGGVLGKVGGAIGAAGNVLGAGALGYMIGNILSYAIQATTSDKNQYGQQSDVLEKVMGKLLPQWAGGMSGAEYQDAYGTRGEPGQKVDKAKPFPGRTLAPPPPPPAAPLAPTPPPIMPGAAGIPAAAAPISPTPQKVLIELATPALKASVQPNRGASN